MAKLLSIVNFVSYNMYLTRSMVTTAGSGSGHVLLGEWNFYLGLFVLRIIAA